MATTRKLWLDTRGQPVITTTPNGERNALRWGWTPAVAVAKGPVSPDELDLDPDEDTLETLQELSVIALHQAGYDDYTHPDRPARL